MNDGTRTKTVRGKNRSMAGSDPVFWREYAPKSLRASGVAPGHSLCALHTNFLAIPRPQYRKFLPEQIDVAHMHDPKSNRGERPMPLPETGRARDRPGSRIVGFDNVSIVADGQF